MKKLLCLAGLLIGLSSYAQECPDLLNPLPGSTNVPVTETISWENIVGVTGYTISLGTTPGGNEILRNSVGAATSFTPPLGLPDDTLIYVTITLFILGQPDIICDSFSFRTEDVTTPPGCTTLAGPLDGSTGIPVGTNIRWDYSPTATSYSIAIGSTPGGTDILPLTDIGNVLSYNPPADLPELSDIYVTVIPNNENGPATGCIEETFRTGALATLPTCSSLISPADGALNVPLSPRIEWTPVPGADGYRVFIGTSPTVNDVLDGSSFSTTSTNVIDFDPNSIYYIRIVPFNAAGEAIDCGQEVFTTILGCGPFFDATTGELVDLSPELDFPEVIGICADDPSTVITASNAADGYRWFLLEPGRETLIQEGPDFDVPGEGNYRLEIYDNNTGPGGDFECSSSQEFTVVASSAPQIDATNTTLGAGVIRIEIEVSGLGDYEFALGDPAGPYQSSNTFSNLPVDSYRVFVRDINGCGTVEVLVEPDLTLEGFPEFFTPNGDNVNDFWQYIVPPSGINPITRITIFDRYGNLLAQIDPNSRGWDGNSNGQPVPPNDYWFMAEDRNGGSVRGHFTLKR
ncbi:T9SS type B sorting domain-containing protein [Robiginitalea myxolifaciens]|nr:T9SS type B sorting domain-containing protein [Robiginitalea myxolifaciens]